MKVRNKIHNTLYTLHTVCLRAISGIVHAHHSCKIVWVPSFDHFQIRTNTEASSTTRVLSSARCTDARLYTLRIKIGTRITSARKHSPCSTRLRFQIRLRQLDISAFSGQIKVTKMCPKYLLSM